MISFPNAKINIGLNITGKRPDGYHNIETMFFPIEMNDVLEVIPSETSQDEKDASINIYGLDIDGNENDNLTVKAYRLLKNDFNLPAIDIYLQKNIPMGAGLGGGSADAAFMLTALNKMFELGLTDEKLQYYAAQLGADCPFFILNRPTLASGIGNIFSPINVDLSQYRIEVIKPDIHVSTVEAYRGCKPRRWDTPLSELLKLPVTEWKDRIVNDFENSVFATHPQLAEIKESMYDKGAVYASMSGSGSSIYGIFTKEQP